MAEKPHQDADTLDDPGEVARRDPNGMFTLLRRWPEQWKEAAALAREARLPGGAPPGGFRHVVISGMGGSAIGGDLLRSHLADSLAVPLVVNRSYACPGFVGPDTLFVAVSYSGNTEETLASLADALHRGAEVVGVTSGGALGEECRRAGKTVLIIPRGLPPRQALGHLFLPALGLLAGLGLAPDPSAAIEETGKRMREWVRAYGPEVPARENEAKRLAASLRGRVPVVYGVQDRTDAVALRWRGQFHENSKNWASSNVLPELDHNEINAWASLSELTRRCVTLIFLEDEEDGGRMVRRREITRELIAPHVSACLSVRSSGRCRLARLFSLIVLGDFASCYLAVLNRVDPLPVPVIEDLKKALAAPSPTE
ncbi:MAG: bifunctional phosphoglucose/phosphomannose isomerase [Candidatus Tectomicrobia bacterium]|nr:bifunctional phosphoglucose/phosphomannose isomerase [Candidatus Tectomicrobia bacterium]